MLFFPLTFFFKWYIHRNLRLGLEIPNHQKEVKSDHNICGKLIGSAPVTYEQSSCSQKIKYIQVFDVDEHIC
jgi:hypothetical protein